MKNSFSSFQGTRRTLRKATVVLSALAFGLSGCTSHSTAPQQQEQEQYVSASFSIKASDFYDASGSSQNHSVSAASLRRSAQAFSFADVSTLRISVKDKLTNATLYLRYDLSFSAGEWSGSLPFLPKDKALTFSAEARDASGVLLFQGSTDQTLTKSGDSVLISLAAANDGKSYSIPRIRKISVPSAIRSDQVGNVSFAVEANTGEALTYEITSPEGGGFFTPTNGSITLTGTAGTFVSQYSPPNVTSEAQFEHTVKITNASGNSVVTTFKTQVKPPGTTSGVTDNGIQVLFRPVINSVTASRQLGTGDVRFQVDVAAEDPSSLAYHWDFTPTQGTHFDPMPAFSGDTNPTTLKNYTTAVQGVLSFEVTDKNGGKTTVTYPLPVNQFPDNPVVEGGLTGINSIRAGDAHTCVLFNNGAVRCWGLNTSGQLGYGNTLHVGDGRKPYEAGDVGLVGVGAKLVTGGAHTCALLDTGLVRCWGNNDFGQLGLNIIGNVGDAEPIANYGYVNLGGIAVKLAAGSAHTCALMNTGKVRCWGHNNLGQLGYGDSTTDKVGDDEQPYSEGDVDLGGGTVKDITAGGAHTCALLDTGAVRCWGYNAYGQLGTGNTINVGMHDKPTAVAEVNVGGPVKQLSAGYNHTCALLVTGNVRCWGYNGNGQLGYNHTSNIYSPTSAYPSAGDVDTDGPVLQVSAGNQHTCALLATGDIKCWGLGANGRLGYGNTNSRLAPFKATVDLDGSSAYQVEAGGGHTCALLVTGAARCWGYNAFGQLGYGHAWDVGDDELPSAAGDIRVLAP